MPAERVEDGDIFRINDMAKRLIENIRSGGGPAFMECVTCRWKEHVGPNDDFHLGYRCEAEVAPWKENDQLVRLRALLDSQTVDVIESAVEKEIKDAFSFAEGSPFPYGTALYADLFKE